MDGNAEALSVKLESMAPSKSSQFAPVKGFESPSPLIFRARVLLGSICITAIAFPSIWQSIVDRVYEFLCGTTLYRLSTFETIWTVFCYAAIEPYITHVYVQQPERRFVVQELRSTQRIAGNSTSSPAPRRPKGMRRPSRRLVEGLTYVLPLLIMDLTMIKKFAGVSLEDMLLSGNYDPTFALSQRAANNSTTQSLQYHHQTFLVPSLHNFTLSSPLQTQRALPPFAPSSRRLVLELVTSFFIYDTLFFLFHLALHTAPVLKSLHTAHHAHKEIHPQVTNKLSVAERLGLVLLANFSLNIIGSHVLTRTLFVPLFVWLLVEIHSGLDLAWAYDKILPRGWAGGARKHAKHHENAEEGGLEPFFGWWDALLERWRR